MSTPNATFDVVAALRDAASSGSEPEARRSIEHIANVAVRSLFENKLDALVDLHRAIEPVYAALRAKKAKTFLAGQVSVLTTFLAIAARLRGVHSADDLMRSGDVNLELLRVLRDSDVPIGKTKLAERAGFPKETVGRNLQKLQRAGLVYVSRGGKEHPTEISELGLDALEREEERRRAAGEEETRFRERERDRARLQARDARAIRREHRKATVEDLESEDKTFDWLTRSGIICKKGSSRAVSQDERVNAVTELAELTQSYGSKELAKGYGSGSVAA